VHLVIANKAYSSWSMRPWLVMKHIGLEFSETVIPLRQPGSREKILAHSPSGKVPVLIDGDVTVWESVAIVSHLADVMPDAPIWPAGRTARAHAKAISLEMHGGFLALRQSCPMNFMKRMAKKDFGPDVSADVARVCAIWRDTRARFAGSDGEFLFGAFSAADAMYAPVVSRFDTYQIDVDAPAERYMQAVRTHPLYEAWRADGLAEPWSIPDYEVGFEVEYDYRAGSA